jgi:hypothetical protein
MFFLLFGMIDKEFCFPFAAGTLPSAILAILWLLV